MGADPGCASGVQAPLGWVLSDAARADLASELERDDGFAALAALLDENVTCDP